MKKIIALVVCLLITASAFAFDPGEKLVWGSADFESYTPYKDADPITTFGITTMVSYFLMKDISLDVLLEWGSTSYKSSKSETYTYSDLLIGLGGSFFINNFYVGAGIGYEILSQPDFYKSDNVKQNAMYLSLGGGYLFPLIENVYIDIGADYTFGLGDYSGDADGKNEESVIGVGAGIVVEIP